MADRRKSRIQITKYGLSKLGFGLAAESRVAARIFGGIGSDFSRAAAAIPSLKTRNWARCASYNASESDPIEEELDFDP